jgi:hypothetical protein
VVDNTFGAGGYVCPSSQRHRALHARASAESHPRVLGGVAFGLGAYASRPGTTLARREIPSGRKTVSGEDGNRAKSSLGDAKSSLGDATSSLGDAKSSLGDAESSLGDAESSLSDAESSLGDAESSLGDAESSLGGTCRPPRPAWLRSSWCSRPFARRVTTSFPRRTSTAAPTTRFVASPLQSDDSHRLELSSLLEQLQQHSHQNQHLLTGGTGRVRRDSSRCSSLAWVLMCAL